MRDTVSEITGGQLADVVIDVVPNVADTFVDAIEIVKHGGTIVMAAMKGDVAVKNLFTDRIALKAITVKGVLSKPSSAYTMAISILESMKFPFEKLQAWTYVLQDAVEAIDALAGRVPGENPDLGEPQSRVYRGVRLPPRRADPCPRTRPLVASPVEHGMWSIARALVGDQTGTPSRAAAGPPRGQGDRRS